MLGWEFPPHISGGLGTACAGIVRSLCARGTQVVLVLPRVHGDEQHGGARLLDGREFRARAPVAEAPARCKSIALDSPLTPYLTPATYASRRASRSMHAALSDETRWEPGEAGFAGGYGGDLFEEVQRYASVVEALCRRVEFDVVHAHDWMTFPAGKAAARSGARPLVAHVHACEFDRSPGGIDVRIRDIEQEALREADRIVCVSEFTARLLESHYEVDRARLRVVHNAVESAPRPFGARESHIPEPIVLFVGRVTFQKGPDYFLEAAARVVRLEPRVKFVLCGAGDQLAASVERAAQLGLARHVHFTGFLDKPELERMFRQAAVYVMPSVSEPFGITPLEAMAHGVPVIVSRQSGVTEVVHSALKVDYWNVEELANKILAVIKRPALAAQLRSQAQTELGSITWDDRACQLNRLYGELCAEASA